MVGVAERSKGCATCRRRKVKCDSIHPACDRCSKAGLTCEGYERYAVFLRKGLDGWEKRKPLEETRPRAKKNTLTATSEGHYCKSVESSRALPLELKSIAIQAVPFMDYFFRDFICSPNPKILKQDYIDPDTWTHGLKYVKGSDSLLHNVLMAVSMVYCGKTRRDRDLLIQGRTWYCRSLCQLSRLLNNDTSSRDDQVLMSTSVCMAYETIDPSDPKSSIGWIRHFVGMTKLLEHRGPTSFGDVQSRDILEDTRYMAMMSGLMRRRSSFLEEELWMTAPWDSAGKSVRQQVADCGLLLGSILQNVETVLGVKGSNETVKLIEECLMLDMRLVIVGAETPGLLTNHPKTTEVFMLQSTTSVDCSSIAEMASKLRLGITILGIRLCTHETINSLACSGNVPDTVVHRLPIKHESRALATSTLDLVERYLALDIGSIAKGRHVFALERARAFLEQDDEELSRCDQLLRTVQVDDWDKDYKKHIGKAGAVSEKLEGNADLDSWCVMVTSPRR